MTSKDLRSQSSSCNWRGLLHSAPCSMRSSRTSHLPREWNSAFEPLTFWLSWGWFVGDATILPQSDCSQLFQQWQRRVSLHGCSRPNASQSRIHHPSPHDVTRMLACGYGDANGGRRRHIPQGSANEQVVLGELSLASRDSNPHFTSTIPEIACTIPFCPPSNGRIGHCVSFITHPCIDPGYKSSIIVWKRVRNTLDPFRQALAAVTAGHVMTLCASDAERFAEVCIYIHFLWIGPLAIIGSLGGWPRVPVRLCSLQLISE